MASKFVFGLVISIEYTNSVKKTENKSLFLINNKRNSNSKKKIEKN